MSLVKLNNKIVKLNGKLVTMIPPPPTFDDWFLPSKDEATVIYNQLYLFGVGGFLSSDEMWTSSGAGAGSAWMRAFVAATDFTTRAKNSTIPKTRAVRSFTSGTVYNLRDVGPAGGRIFITGATYYEMAPTNQSTNQVWSNIDNVNLVGTGTAIGTGSANTDLIIGQVGHTTSAAKLCKDLVI
jgi:hypothetical protein